MRNNNIDLDDLTPEAKAELSKYIRTCAREEVKRIFDKYCDKCERIGFNLGTLRAIIKEICDET